MLVEDYRDNLRLWLVTVILQFYTQLIFVTSQTS